VRAMASASFGDDFFMYGGLFYPGKYVKSLLRLDTKTYRWSELSGPRNSKATSPMAKSGASMVACGDNLALFAGYGIPDGPAQPGSSFLKSAGYTDGRGSTNEFHIFNLKQGMTCSFTPMAKLHLPLGLSSLVCVHYTVCSSLLEHIQHNSTDIFDL